MPKVFSTAGSEARVHGYIKDVEKKQEIMILLFPFQFARHFGVQQFCISCFYCPLFRVNKIYLPCMKCRENVHSYVCTKVMTCKGHDLEVPNILLPHQNLLQAEFFETLIHTSQKELIHILSSQYLQLFNSS